ncbi:MAG: hypothetical protein R3E39_18010 [Anaerolineae bacterium]
MLRLRPPLWLLAVACFALMAAALWLPFGLNITDFSDTWVFYGSLDAGLPFLSDSRPFQLVMYHVAYAIDHNSFIGANILMLLFFIGKSLAVYGGLRLLLPQQPLFAFLSAALLMLFPADTGTFWLAAFNVHSPVFFYFLAVFSLLWYWRSPHGLKLLLMGGSLVWSFTYEANYPLIILTPLLLWVANGRLSRRVVRVTVLWYIVPVIMVARLFLIAGQQGSGAFLYQEALLQQGLGGGNIVARIADSFLRAYQRNIGTGWVETVLHLKSSLKTQHLLVALVMTGLTMVVAWRHSQQSTIRLNVRQIAILLVAGLVIIGAGFASFIITNYRDINYRVFFLSALGGALIAVTGISVISQLPERAKRMVFIPAVLSPIIFNSRIAIVSAVAGGLGLLLLPGRMLLLILSSGLVLVGMLGMLRQHDLYATMPLRQHWLQASIIQQAPAVETNAVLVLLDETDDMRGALAFEARRDVFDSSLKYLYNSQAVTAVLCATASTRPDGLVGQCYFRDDGFEETWERGPHQFGYDQLIVFRYSDNEGAVLLDTLPDWMPSAASAQYHPRSLIVADAPLPDRVFTVFPSWPVQANPPIITLGELRG